MPVVVHSCKLNQQDEDAGHNTAGCCIRSMALTAVADLILQNMFAHHISSFENKCDAHQSDTGYVNVQHRAVTVVFVEIQPLASSLRSNKMYKRFLVVRIVGIISGRSVLRHH